MKKHNVQFLARAGILAAIYVVLTMISGALGLASGAIQVRLSEMLCILPVFTFAAVPGVTVGCLLSNILLGGTIYDIVFGTLATFLGALIAYFLRKNVFLAPIPTIVANGTIIPVVLIVSGIGTWDLLLYFVLTVSLGEIIACGILGTALTLYLKKHRSIRTMLFGS